MLRRILFAFLLSGVIASPVTFADDEFSKNNPDINKYEFARSYITSLSYLKAIHVRWEKDNPKKLFPNDKNKMMLAEVNNLALDSSDLLVVKNYLNKYLTSPNMLMRKVADMVVVATAQEVAINHEEKTLWEKWYDLNAAGQATRAKEIEFVDTQYTMELQRKEQDKKIVEASIMMTKVLISDQNQDGKGHLLAVTAEQRQKLLDKLDSFGSDELDWGLKPGQNTLEGCIAAIREILEDSIWISIDEKSK